MPFGVYGSGPQCSCFTILSKGFFDTDLVQFWDTITQEQASLTFAVPDFPEDQCAYPIGNELARIAQACVFLLTSTSMVNEMFVFSLIAHQTFFLKSIEHTTTIISVFIKKKNTDYYYYLLMMHT